jgi:hypothetical protein
MVLIRMKKNLFIILIAAFFALPASSQSVIFYKENLVMKLDAAHVTVTGEYSFRNNYATDANQTMFLPLPLATGDLKIDSISVFDETSQSHILHYRRLPAGLFFQLTFHGQEQKKIRIFYIMDHDGRNVRYLVMTHVQYWKKPLSQGTYTLQVEDPSIIIDSTSYKPDQVQTVNSKTIHTWHKVNFNPDRELDIWFHRQKQN